MAGPESPGALPEFVPPMLARLGRAPFDSDEHVFEIKWDGTRVLAFVEAGGLRLRNRKGRDVGPTYPDVAGLASLPAGTLVDGEVVVLVEGKASFEGMLRREQVRGARNVAAAALRLPATYVAFDLLYDAGASIMERPLAERRARLEELVGAAAAPRVAFSEGVVGAGLTVFAEVERQGLEGMVAKGLDSPYRPGRRTDDWTKIKTFSDLACVVLGYVPDETGGIKSLVVAADEGGGLRCVGRVGSGLSEAHRRELQPRLDARARPEPLVPCPFEGRWVEPEIFCTVSFLEHTSDGMLRAPVFKGLLTDK